MSDDVRSSGDQTVQGDLTLEKIGLVQLVLLTIGLVVIHL